jgi:hypothetical protein
MTWTEPEKEKEDTDTKFWLKNCMERVNFGDQNTKKLNSMV